MGYLRHRKRGSTSTNLSSRFGPVYGLLIVLLPVVSPLLDNCIYTVKNFDHFVNMFKNINIKNSKIMASFDVVNLVNCIYSDFYHRRLQMPNVLTLKNVTSPEVLKETLCNTAHSQPGLML